MNTSRTAQACRALRTAAILAVATPAFAQNLVTNPGFESGNTGFSSGYIPLTVPSTPGTYGVSSLASALWYTWYPVRDHTSGRGKMMCVNGTNTSTGTNVWRETIPVRPDTRYIFGVWSAMIYKTPSPILQLKINTAQVSLASVAGPTGTWRHLSGTWNSGAATSATIKIADLLGADFGNDFALDDITFGECVQIVSQPASITICPESEASFSVEAGGLGPFTYQWQRQNASFAWVNISDGPAGVPGAFAGALTDTLTISDPGPDSPGAYRCVVTDACRTVDSDPATLAYCGCLSCPADFNQDGGVDGSDAQAFFGRWEEGSCDADVNADGGVDGSDVDFFFAAWTAGGCG